MESASGISEKNGLSTRFKVNISGGDHRNSGGKSSGVIFTRCDGIQSEIDVVFLNDGGRLDAIKPVRGSKRGNVISFSMGVVESNGGKFKDFYEWFDDVCDSGKPLKKKTLNVMLLDSKSDDHVVAQWEISGAWPCRWVGPLLDISDNIAAVDQLTFAYEMIKRV